MTLIAIDGGNPGQTANIVRGLKTVCLGLADRYRRWRHYRRTVEELRQYADYELVELGISRYDIDDVARADTGRFLTGGE